MTRTDTRQGHQAQTQQGGQMVAADGLRGTFADPAAVNDRLDDARRQRFNLVTPAPHVGYLQDGFAAALNVVQLDAQLDCYQVDGGKYAPHKHALERIATAAGISWDAQQSGRLDDGRDPHYCHWQAVGTVRHFDGTIQTLVGSRQIDLRNGSDEAADMRPKQLQQQRIRIAELAETKARLRAIASMGIKRSYTRDELSRPFVIARLMFTGRTEDPALRQAFAMMAAQSFLGASRALYGHGATPPRALPQPSATALPPLGTQPAPPVGAVEAEIEDAPAALDVRIHGGDEDGRPIGEASTEALSAYADRLDGAIQAGRVRDHAAAMAALDACLTEMDRRRGPAEEIY